MTASGSDLRRLIDRARRDEPGALDRLLDSYRNYLRLLARTGVDASLQGKADASDLVQEALLKASQNFGQFRGATDAELAGWLRQILANQLLQATRAFTAAGRDVGRERSLEAALENASARLERWLSAEQSSPGLIVQRQEQLARLAEALAQLPEDQRTAVELHHLQGVRVAELARQMGRSGPAVTNLLYRALKRLRELLAQDEE